MNSISIYRVNAVLVFGLLSVLVLTWALFIGALSHGPEPFNLHPQHYHRRAALGGWPA